jgi:spectinomycin phosphotransferase
MREPPAEPSEADVLDAVGTRWAIQVDAIEYLPLGFGAHHWKLSSAATPRLFVTLDRLGTRHTAQSLEAAYGAASTLALSGLEFVVAPLPSRSGRFTVPLAAGMLSCTPWVADAVAGTGRVADEALAVADADALSRLHGAEPPAGIPLWHPLVDRRLVVELVSRTAEPWTSGTYGERVRRLLVQHLAEISRWTARYHDLADRARQRRWVPTHGEPHTANQLIACPAGAPPRPRFVDWESLALAPAERDLRTLVDSGFAPLVTADPPMLEMFDLEWRLDEISQYADWFSSPHGNSADDRIAFDGLVEELAREDWSEPG